MQKQVVKFFLPGCICAFAKSLILDVWKGSEDASEMKNIR